MKLKNLILLATTITSFSGEAACLMINKPIAPKTITCNGAITKYDGDNIVLTGKRVKLEIDLGRRSSCYTSFIKYKVSVFKDITITETIYNDGEFPESGESKTVEGIKGKIARGLLLENYRPSLGVDIEIPVSGALSSVSTFSKSFLQNLDFSENSYRDNNRKLIVNPNFRGATLECRSDY